MRLSSNTRSLSPWRPRVKTGPLICTSRSFPEAFSRTKRWARASAIDNSKPSQCDLQGCLKYSKNSGCNSPVLDGRFKLALKLLAVPEEVRANGRKRDSNYSAQRQARRNDSRDGSGGDDLYCGG